jgi:iron complex outermembrane recepter protein
MRIFRMIIFAMTITLPAAVFAQDLAQNDFKKLSLEELMRVDVTSVSRNAQPLNRTAAAITVLTSEDIRRSGVTNIPEALRLIPGLQVARQNSGSWAISARGFNGVAANKMLVLIDGRTVYSPVFSGTFWEVQDYLLDDIDRIEVVRGPGATLYGANAVNGIINIVTKSAHDTKGMFAAAAGGGAEDLGSLSLRNGGSIGRDASYRVFGKYFYRDQAKLGNGQDSKDSIRVGRAGFRADHTQGASDFTVEGDAYSGLSGIQTRDDAKVFGGNILGRWTQQTSTDSELKLQVYFDKSYRRVPLQSDFHQKTFDIDLQHGFPIGSVQHLTWGAGYRYNKDATRQTVVLSFVPEVRSYPLVTAFIQDEIAFLGDRGNLVFGSKVEHNDFTGFEVQPSIRASYSIRPEHSVWAAVSRAIRTPTRFDTDIRFAGITGNPDFHSERVLAYEFGVRLEPKRQLSFDVAVFHNDYDNLRSVELRLAPIGFDIRNNLNAKTHGAEIAANYDVLESVRFKAAYSFLGKRLTMEPGARDFFNSTLEGNDPKHQFWLQGTSDLPHNFELDGAWRFVDNLPSPAVPRYHELDLRLGWNPTPEVGLSLVGRNLLHDQHPEFGPGGPAGIQIERNIYGRVILRF